MSRTALNTGVISSKWFKVGARREISASLLWILPAVPLRLTLPAPASSRLAGSPVGRILPRSALEGWKPVGRIPWKPEQGGVIIQSGNLFQHPCVSLPGYALEGRNL
ncbi:MAG: hypothetical protein MUP03_04610 [Anaerolineales bacterium]|nr:hypothetical protein [Anaerolineales bacterium]